MHTDQLNKAIDSFAAKLLETVGKRLEEALPANKEVLQKVLADLRAELKDELSLSKAGKRRAAKLKGADAPKRKASPYNEFMAHHMKLLGGQNGGGKQPELMRTIAAMWRDHKAKGGAAVPVSAAVPVPAPAPAAK
jgi:hypothetical protein